MSISVRLLLLSLACSLALVRQGYVAPARRLAHAPRTPVLTALRRRAPLCCASEQAEQLAAEQLAAEQLAVAKSERQAKAEALRIVAENREIRSLALPALVNTLIDPILSLIDTIFVGRLPGTVALGATAAASELFTLCLALSLSLRESASSTLARLTASNQPAAARDFAIRSIQLGILLGTFLSFLIGGPWAVEAVSIMGAPVTSPLHADALAYARWRALALPAALGFSACEGVFRGLGNTSVVLRAAAVAAVVNAVLDPLAIFRPMRMGVGGAAAATALAQWISFGLLLRKLAPRLSELEQEEGNGSAAPRAGALGEATSEATSEASSEAPSAESIQGSNSMARTSGASLIRATSVLGTWAFITSSVSRQLGPSAIAAHGVVLKVWLLFCLSCEAPAVAGQVLCARRLVIGQKKQAQQLLLRLLRLAFVQGLVAMLAILAFARPAARFLIPSDPATAATALRLFSWAACSAPLVSPCVLLEQASRIRVSHTSLAHTSLAHTSLAHTSLAHTSLAHKVPHTPFPPFVTYHLQHVHACPYLSYSP